MPGYEDLTADQLMYIVNFIGMVILISVGMLLLRSFIMLKVSKNVKSLELMIEKKIDEGLHKPSFFETLKIWRSECKKKKEERELSKPLGF